MAADKALPSSTPRSLAAERLPSVRFGEVGTPEGTVAWSANEHPRRSVEIHQRSHIPVADLRFDFEPFRTK